MLRMVDKEYIRKKHFLEGWSIRELSRQLKVSRKTVRKMLRQSSGIPQLVFMNDVETKRAALNLLLNMYVNVP